MNNRLYIGNLPPETTEQNLRELFSTMGAVTEVALVIDPATQQSRGSAFVTMATSQEAAAAITGLHSYRLGGRNLAVTEARPPSKPTGLIGEGFESGMGRFAPQAVAGRKSKGSQRSGRSRRNFRG